MPTPSTPSPESFHDFLVREQRDIAAASINRLVQPTQPELRLQESASYEASMAGQSLVEALRTGIPVRQFFNEGDAQYCLEFLELMSERGFPQSEQLQEYRPHQVRREPGSPPLPGNRFSYFITPPEMGLRPLLMTNPHAPQIQRESSLAEYRRAPSWDNRSGNIRLTVVDSIMEEVEDVTPRRPGAIRAYRLTVGQDYQAEEDIPARESTDRNPLPLYLCEDGRIRCAFEGAALPPNFDLELRSLDDLHRFTDLQSLFLGMKPLYGSGGLNSNPTYDYPGNDNPEGYEALRLRIAFPGSESGRVRLQEYVRHALRTPPTR